MNRMKNMTTYDLEERTSKFAKQIRSFVKKLPRTVANTEDSRQVIRSSGSVAANYIEANESVGSGDFLMRVKICLKESKESALWLDICEVLPKDEPERQQLYSEARQFVRIFSTILRNAKRNMEHSKIAV